MASVSPDVRVGGTPGAPHDPVTFPELYDVAESTAQSGRHGFVRIEQIDLLLLLGGALFSTIAVYAPADFKIWNFVVAAALLGVTTIMKSANTILHADRDWIDGRAAAESIKSLSWQYMMRVAPFDAESSASNVTFIGSLAATMEAHPTLRPARMPAGARVEQITDSMRRVRGLPWPERPRYYVDQRLGEQIAWYAARAVTMRRAAMRYFWIDLVARAAALTFAVLVIVLPQNKPSLAGLFSAVAAAATAWSQLGRNDELSRTYATMAQKLALRKSLLDEQFDEQSFGRLVVETEGMIAHETSSWTSKRG